MCGIAGYLDKTKNEEADIGQTLYKMLEALGRRGPDSAGIAIYNHQLDGDMVLRVKLGEAAETMAAAKEEHFAEKGRAVTSALEGMGDIGESAITSDYLRLVVDYDGDPKALERTIEAGGEELEVVSMGRNLEIVKQVGSPQNLDATHNVSKFIGSHGIGHTRMSTESRIDLSHSQPFWAHGYPDLATVHNGHICNYHKLRRIYEQRGVKFYTENDSEIIGIYLAEQLSEGKSFEEALTASLSFFDGSFSYFASTPDAMGYARDPFALKPLLYTETDDFVALATEGKAIQAAFELDLDVREAGAGEVRVWQR